MKKRPVLIIIQSVLCIACAASLITADLMIYFQGLAERSDNPMADIYSVSAITEKAVPVLVLLIASIVVTVLCAILKVKDPHAGGAASVSIRKNTDKTMPASSVNIIRTVLLIVAVIFIVIGIFNGSLEDVFIKAANICTECIGLG